MKIPFTWLLLLFCSVSTRAQEHSFVIRGHLLGADSKPISFSEVHLESNANRVFGPGRDILMSRRVNPDGSFSLRFDSPGMYRLIFTGASHHPRWDPILILRPDTVTLNVRLRANELKDSLSNIMMIGDFNAFSLTPSQAIILRKTVDGLFTAKVAAKADTFAYQIYYADKRRVRICGTQSDYYVLTPECDYISVLRCKLGDSLAIIFDPRKLGTPGISSAITFEPTNHIASKFLSFDGSLNARRDRYVAARRAYIATGKSESEFSYDYTRDIAELMRLRESEPDPVIKNALLLAAAAEFHGIDKDTSVARSVLRSLSPVDPLWSHNPDAMTNCIARSGDARSFLTYQQEAIDSHPDRTLKPRLMQGFLYQARSAALDSLVAIYYRKMSTWFPESQEYLVVKQEFDPNRVRQVGRQIPDFSVPSIEDSTIFYSKKSLLGNTYLLDFWAVWCAPCVSELKNVSAAYERFKSKGLKVLSFSFDFKPDQVAAFRKKKWPMPWFHTHVKLGGEDPVAKLFEIRSIPMAVLVGPDGKILAVGNDLMGDALEVTLSKAFANSQ